MPRDGEVRGITILYDQAMEGTMDPLVAPMSSAFVPFAVAGYALAGAPTRRAARSSTAPASWCQPRGHVLTDRNLIDGCNVIAVRRARQRRAHRPDDQAASSRCCASMARAT